MFNKFGYPEFSSKGEKILTTRDGIYKDMMMDIRIYRMQKDDTLSFYSDKDETAVLLQEGNIEFQWQDGSGGIPRSAEGSRGNVFDDGAYGLHVSHGIKITVTARSEAEILVQKTENGASFPGVFYSPVDFSEMVSGQGLCENTAVRIVRTMFDYNNAPYSNMVLGEVVGRQGSWSSYIPHHHPQPEVYYYRFERPEGFGACFIGDDVFKIKDGSFCAIPGGLTHPQVSAPGYRLYTCWMIRHFDGNPWTDRIDDPEYTWLLDTKI